MSDFELYYKISSELYFLSTTLLSAYCLAYWIKPFFPPKSGVWKIGIVYFCTMIVLNYMPLFIPSVAAYSIGAFMAFFTMCLVDRSYISQKLFLAITFFCLRWQAWRVVIHIVNITFRFSILLFKDQGELFWFWFSATECVLDALTGFLLLYGCVRLLLRVYGRKRENMEIREFLILLIPAVSSIYAYGATQFLNNAYVRDSGKHLSDTYTSYDFLMIFYPVICYITILTTVYVFRQWKKEHEEDKRREVFSKQIQDLESHITETEKLYKDMRNLRHDIGNHLMTLKQLYTQGEYEAAEKYADSLTCEMQKAASGTQSGNPVTDVILSERKKEMDEKGIGFSCDFHYPADGEINAFDISIILNNGLSNAIESIERECHCAPHIFLCSYRMKNMFVIEIANSFTGELVTDDQSGLPVTAKSGEGHGFGLSSIRHTARKYLGDIEIGREIYKQEKCCVLRVMLQTM